MKSMIWRRLAVTASVWSGVVLAVALASDAALGASTNPTMTVVNTTANPVPVSGSITVGNSVVPVEVSNADPISVSVQTQPAAVRGRWFARFITDMSPVIFTVPAGKRRVVTDVIATISTTDNTSAPGLTMYNECEDNVTKEVLGQWYALQNYGNLFSVSEHLTTGIVFNAGDCLKFGSSNNTKYLTVLWYDENAN